MRLPTFDEIAAREAARLVSVDHGPDGLRLCNYTPRCVYSGAWDEVTLQCRGLLLDADGAPVARPWGKFFNLGEPHAPSPDGSPESLTVKHDGALGILYRHDGRIRWTTRGCLTSPQGAVGQRLWDEHHAGVSVPDAWTVLAEIIHPDTRVIVPYEWEGLIVLGARDRWTGADVPLSEVRAWCEASGLRCVEEVPLTLEAAREVAAKLDATAEGFVARWADGTRVKIKGTAYLEVARLLSGMTERVAADYWYARLPLPEALPEETRQWAEALWPELDAEAAAIADRVSMILARHRHRSTDRGGFVRAVKSEAGRHFGLVMSALDGRFVDCCEVAYRERYGSRPRGVALGAM